MMFLFLTGVGAAFLLAYWGNPEIAMDEAPGLWFLILVPQQFLVFLAALRFQHDQQAGALARQAAGFTAASKPSLVLPAHDDDDGDGSLSDDDDDDYFERDGDDDKFDAENLSDHSSGEEEHALVAIGSSGATQVRRRKRL
jgi:hypothetical protein